MKNVNDTFCVCVCECECACESACEYIRSSRVHDAGRHVAHTLAPVVMVHPQVVTQLMSNDGGKGRQVVVSELSRGTERGTDRERRASQ